jgi:hypothetical protein
LVGAIWAMLVVNALGTLAIKTIVPIPKPVLQAVTMGALGLAFLLALVINPRVRVRPNGFLVLLTLLLVVAIASSSTLDSGLGSLVRCARLAMFTVTLWLISCWWDGSLRWVRYHVRTLAVILTTVALGYAIAPGTARSADFQDRLVGVIWPIAATQVADYGAIAAGLVLILWLARKVEAREAIVIGGGSVVLLVLTHTRTAIVALLAGLVVAAVSLAPTSPRSRRALVSLTTVGVVVGVGLAGPLMVWFQRGQDADALNGLTGRQQTWDALLAAPRDAKETLVGVGLTDNSFGGLSIDSTWLTVFYEEGMIGVVLVVLIMVSLAGAALLRPPSPARACALFIIVYGAIASYTQTGLGDVSSYTVHFVLAAILLTQGAGKISDELVRPRTAVQPQGAS